uniref:FecR protein domain-containing protein n=1 Tax=candidate division WOR-3 bacterium TaxID=2052148 RepID=A0A7C3N902_UNCW3
MEKKKIIFFLLLISIFLFPKEVGVVKNSKGNIFQNEGEEKEPLKRGDIVKDSFNVELEKFSLLEISLIDGKSELSVFGESEFSLNIFDLTEDNFFRLNISYGNFLIKSDQNNFQIKLFDTFIFSDSSSFFINMKDSIAKISIIYCNKFDVENQFGKVSGSKNDQIILIKGENPYKVEKKEQLKGIEKNKEGIVEIEFEDYKNDTLYINIEK